MFFITSVKQNEEWKNRGVKGDVLGADRRCVMKSSHSGFLTFSELLVSSFLAV